MHLWTQSWSSPAHSSVSGHIWGQEEVGRLTEGTALDCFKHTDVQWNLSIEDNIGTQLAVLYREVYLIHR